MKKLLSIFSTILFLNNFLIAQNVSINTDGSLPHPNAMLDIKGVNKGLLIPRGDAATRAALNSNTGKGLLMYDTITNTFWAHNGNASASGWQSLSTGNNYWQLAGALGTEIQNTNSGGLWSANASTVLSEPLVLPPVSGTGTRLMWMPNKSAFRAGTVDGNDWNADSIGTWSTGIGFNARAKGAAAISLGTNTQASGYTAIATGYGTKANGSISTAMGENTIADGPSSLSAGKDSRAKNYYAIAMGDSAIANGFSSVSIGSHTYAELYSLAMGFRSQATGIYCVAIGDSTYAYNNGAVSLGYRNQSSGLNSTTMGGLNIAIGDYATAMGRSNFANGQNSTATGNGTFATGLNSFSTGFQSHSEGNSSFSFGNYTYARGAGSISGGFNSFSYGDFSIALGSSATTTGMNSFSTGQGTRSSGDNTFAIGVGTVARSYNSLALGIYNDSVITSCPNCFDGNNPLLYVGNGTNDGNRHNAMVVYQNGNMILKNPLSVTVDPPSYTLPITGAGTRMMWMPEKASFRTGTVNNTQWDAANIGLHSFAAGVNNVASGYASFAMGSGDTASGNFSVALGINTKATYFYSTAMGSGTAASNVYSVAMGSNTVSNGLASTAMGSNTKATGDYSTATGSNTEASGPASVAAGGNTIAAGQYSIATGFSTKASGIATVAMGQITEAGGSQSVAMGFGTNARPYSSLAIGRYNDSVISSSKTSWISTDPLLILGNGSTDAARSNAMVVYKDGNTDISGYTQLGKTSEAAPAIKMKKLTVNTPATQGAFNFVAHGLTQSKILSVTALVTVPGGYQIIPNHEQAGFKYTLNVDNGNIAVGTVAGNSASILNMPVKIVIIYEE